MASDLDFLDYSTGTITLTSGSVNFTTQGAALNLVGIHSGDDLRVKGWIVTIASITGSNSGTLRAAWPQATQTAQPYAIRGTPDSIRLMERSRALMERLGSGNIDALARLSLTANNLLYADAPGSLAIAPLTSFARGLLASANASAFQTAAGLAAPSFTGPVTFSAGWSPSRDASAVAATKDFNDLITSGHWSLSGNWANGPTNVAAVAITGTAEVHERFWTAGCRFTQIVNINGSMVQRYIRVGTGANGSIVWSAWKKYLFTDDLAGTHDTILTSGNSIAAAATLNLNNATGIFVDITGNTTISAVTLTAGRKRMVRFTGTPQITVGEKLIGNNAGKNIKVEPGDFALFESHASGVVSFWLLRASGAPVRPAHFGRNFIVNPGFQISQENANASSTTSGYHAADQWRTEFSGAFGVTTYRQVNVNTVARSRYRYRIAITNPQTTLGAGDYVMITQPIEGNRIHPFKWGTTSAVAAVLAFTIAAPLGTYTVAIRNRGNTRSFVATFTVTTTGTHRQAIAIPASTTGTFDIDANTGVTVSFVFAGGTQYNGVEGWQDGSYISVSGATNGAAATNAFHIMDVGLYIDYDGYGTAPPFETTDYAADLLECQRYYYTVSGSYFPHRVSAPSSGSLSASAGSLHPVTMRTAPAMSAVWEINDVVQSSTLTALQSTQYYWTFVHGLSASQYIDVTKLTANARM